MNMFITSIIVNTKKSKKIKNINQKGFTLIELVVAMSIVAIVSTASIASFSNRTRERMLQEAYNAAKDSLRTVQSRALSEVGNPGAAEDQKYKYSGIRFVRDTGTYELFRATEASDSVCVGLDSAKTIIDSTQLLPHSVVARLSSTESPLCIFFEYQTGNTYVSKGSFGVNPCAN